MGRPRLLLAMLVARTAALIGAPPAAGRAHGIGARQADILQHLVAELAQLVALSIYEIFAKLGIKLFDGKIEAAIDRLPDGESKIILADSIGPDELRLDSQGVQLSKEILRVFYRRTDWYKQIESAKEEAESRPGIKWQDILKNEQKVSPPPLSQDMAEAVSQMYLALAAELSGLNLGEKSTKSTLTALKDVPAKLNKALEV